MSCTFASPPHVAAVTNDYMQKILPLRLQATIQDKWLKHRLETIMPEIMRRNGLDAWLIIGREYNEDPLMYSLLPATMLSARRLTMLAFFLRDENTIDRLAVSRYNIEPFYEAAWQVEQEGQWKALTRLIRERDPKRIGINYAHDFAFGDGLSHALYTQMVAALGPELSQRLCSAELAAVGWLEKRSKPEIAAYTGIVEIAHALVAEAFSGRVIHPGVTTPNDVIWWFRERTHQLGLTCWFQPSVSIQRRGRQEVPPTTTIMPGDLLHCDFGLHYLGLATDTQQNAYVLLPGEEEAPIGLQAALATGNRLQDILAAEMQVGRTGNEILRAALTAAIEAGIRASIYTHPIGYHGHGAGPTIGLWDAQQGVPGRGDYPLYNDTCHAMELNVHQAVPEWDGQEIRMALEQDVLVHEERVIFLAGRQTSLHLIK